MNEETDTSSDDADQNNNSDFFDCFSNTHFFRQVIRPMLNTDNEEGLINWFRTHNIIKNYRICINNCGPMIWTSGYGIDMHQWKCTRCGNVASIREDSIFKDINCSFTDCMKIILAWCNDTDFELVSNVLGINRSIVVKLYNTAAGIAQSYIYSNIYEFKMGDIVLINTYPEIGSILTRSRVTRPILCIAEVNSFPPKYWFKVLNDNHPNQTNKKIIMKTIQEIIQPGALIILPENHNLCTPSDIEAILDLHPNIVTVESLFKFNNNNSNNNNNSKENVDEILDVIWKKALDICEQAQFYNNYQIEQYLTNKIWLRRFNNDPYENLLNEMIRINLEKLNS